MLQILMLKGLNLTNWQNFEFIIFDIMIYVIIPDFKITPLYFKIFKLIFYFIFKGMPSTDQCFSCGGVVRTEFRTHLLKMQTFGQKLLVTKHCVFGAV